MEHESVAKALIDSGGVRFSAKDPFILASRKIAPIYIDVRQLTTSPGGWEHTVSALAGLVTKVGTEDVISGGELADLFFSIPVALKLGLPHLAIRKEAKGYGTGGRLVGRIERGQRTVHVSDLITSGTSALEWVKVVGEAGGRIAKYVVVFDRMQGGGAALRARRVPLYSLLRLDNSFLSFAASRGAITRRDVEGIEAYLRDPEAWAKEFLLNDPGFLTRHVVTARGRLVRAEGAEVLTIGYPDLIARMKEDVSKRLGEIGVKDFKLQ